MTMTMRRTSMKTTMLNTITGMMITRTTMTTMPMMTTPMTMITAILMTGPIRMRGLTRKTRPSGWG
jgi:hypothetical protein